MSTTGKRGIKVGFKVRHGNIVIARLNAMGFYVNYYMETERGKVTTFIVDKIYVKRENR